MRSVLALALLVVPLAGCTDGRHELFVDVRSNLAPETELDELVVELLDDRGREGEIVRRTETAVLASHDYAAGRRVAEWSELATGTYYPRVEVRLDGVVIADILAEVALSSDRAVTIFVSRECVGVSCPRVGGDPRATSCLAGVCAPPSCLVGGGSGCPALPDGGPPRDGGAENDGGGIEGGGVDGGVADGSRVDAQPPDGAVLDPDLVAWYRFEVPGEAGLVDYGPYGLDGTCGASQCGSSTDGVVGRAHAFDGFDDNAIVPYDDALDSPHLSVIAWIRSDAHVAGFRMVASIAYGPDYNNSWSLYFNDWEMDGSVEAHFAVSDRVADDRADGVAPAPETWALLAGTYDGMTIRLYVDGVRVDELARAGIAVFDGHDLNIGADSNIGGPLGSYWNGAIDELRIYRRALDGAELAEIEARERP